MTSISSIKKIVAQTMCLFQILVVFDCFQTTSALNLKPEPVNNIQVREPARLEQSVASHAVDMSLLPPLPGAEFHTLLTPLLSSIPGLGSCGRDAAGQEFSSDDGLSMGDPA